MLFKYYSWFFKKNFKKYIIHLYYDLNYINRFIRLNVYTMFFLLNWNFIFNSNFRKHPSSWFRKLFFFQKKFKLKTKVFKIFFNFFLLFLILRKFLKSLRLKWLEDSKFYFILFFIILTNYHLSLFCIMNSNNRYGDMLPYMTYVKPLLCRWYYISKSLWKKNKKNL